MNGDPVVVGIAQAVSREGVAVGMRYDDHLPWPLVIVVHDIGVPHPTMAGATQRVWHWPIWCVKHRPTLGGQ